MIPDPTVLRLPGVLRLSVPAVLRGAVLPVLRGALRGSAVLLRRLPVLRSAVLLRRSDGCAERVQSLGDPNWNGDGA